jgi:hypothetical protein
MSRNLKPLPRNIVQVQQEQIIPYLNQGKPDSNEGTVFSKNRGRDLSFKNNKIKDISIGLEDMDQAIQYYFDNVIRPNVIQNNSRIAVPVIYGDAERWKSVQNDGFYRDQNSKVMVPLIMYRRTNIDKNRTLGNKIDGNKVHNFQVFETRYTQRNQYDNFSVLTNRIPQKQFYVSVVPDYVTITYECLLFTNFVEQNNKLIEAIEFASDSYWGDFNRWHFRTKIDTFAVTNVIEQGSDRAAKTTFTMTLNGYLISDTINKEMANADMFYSPSQIIFGIESVGDVNETFDAASQVAASQVVGTTSFVGGGTTLINTTLTYTGYAGQDATYITTNDTKTADIVTPYVATFTGTLWLQPTTESGLPATSVNNFIFAANGLGISPACVISFVEDGNGNSVLTVDPTILGYYLTNEDGSYKEITATGKFA